MATTHPLRPVVQRLNGTPVQDLPRYAGFLASLILQHQRDLQLSDSSTGGDKILVHKLKARVSSLLQDRTSEGRFTGIVLAKAIIDAGDLGDAESSTNWTRMLLSCLNKQDPPEIKRLAIITLTRIFLLTVDNSPSIRETTTPNLPSFISVTLTLIRPVEVSGSSLAISITSPLLEIVLKCWLHLLPEFPSMFRPYLSSLRTISLTLMSDADTSEPTQDLAMALFAAMHFCAPKNAAAAEWFQMCEQVVVSIHQTGDVLFRSVIEDWHPSMRIEPAIAAVGGSISSVPKIKVPDAIGMERWSGLRSGICRLATLLRLLLQLLTTKHSQAMNVPIALVLEVCGRLAAIQPPTKSFSMRSNAECSREEREELWSQIPYIHVTTLNLLQGVIAAYGCFLRPVSKTIMAQVFDMYEAGKFSINVRAAATKTLAAMLQVSLLQMSRQEQKPFADLLWQCCVDLKSILNSAIKPATLTTASSRASDVEIPTSKLLQDHISAAWDLLPIVLMHTSAYLSSSLRAEIDSCIILLGHKKAMLASVLNHSPLRKGSRTTHSILPFFARLQAGDLNSESLLRPRMPLIRSITNTNEDDEEIREQHEISTIACTTGFNIIEREQDVAEDTQPTTVTQDAAQTLKESSKRVFDIIETESDQQKLLEDAQGLKRSKIESFTFVPNHDSNDVAASYNHMVVPEAETSSVNGAGMSQRPVQTGSTVTSIPQPDPSFTASQVSLPTNTFPAAQQWQKIDHEDDSDEEEIPTIDATMSDDDSDEVMD